MPGLVTVAHAQWEGQIQAWLRLLGEGVIVTVKCLLSKRPASSIH